VVKKTLFVCDVCVFLHVGMSLITSSRNESLRDCNTAVQKLSSAEKEKHIAANTSSVSDIIALEVEQKH